MLINIQFKGICDSRSVLHLDPDVNLKLNHLSGLSQLNELILKAFRLNPNSFGHLPSLRTLKLINCDWSKFGEHSLDSLTSLRDLSISRPFNFTNQLDLSALVNLKNLYLHNCPSTLEILENVNHDLIDLKIFNPSGGFLFNMLLRKLGRFEKLESLRLVHIDIHDFDINWLTNHPNLKYLEITSCKIKTITLNRDSCDSEAKIKDNKQRIFPRLERLCLENNDLESLHRDVFREFSCLKTLDLSDNQLECLPDGVFADLANLEELLIWNNSITKVSGATFAGLVQLRTLDLSFNPLESLEPSAFEDMKNLEKFRLVFTNLSNRDVLQKVYMDKINFSF